MQQIVAIHGGDTFDNEEDCLKFIRETQIDIDKYRTDKPGWKKNLRKQLGNDYEVILPSMPNSINARYIEWQIWFEKLFPYLQDDVILIGHSMGGSFLAKYLTENKFPKKIKAVFLVAACFDKDTDGNGLHTFELPENLSLPTHKIFLYHSKDDPIVPFSDLGLFQKQFPQAVSREFEDRGHFNQEELPEIVKDIKSLA